MVMVAKLCEYTKNYWIVHFKWMNYVLCELWINRAFIIKNKRTPWQHFYVSRHYSFAQLHHNLFRFLLLDLYVSLTSFVSKHFKCHKNELNSIMNPCTHEPLQQLSTQFLLLQTWVWWTFLCINLCSHSALFPSIYTKFNSIQATSSNPHNTLQHAQGIRWIRSHPTLRSFPVWWGW